MEWRYQLRIIQVIIKISPLIHEVANVENNNDYTWPSKMVSIKESTNNNTNDSLNKMIKTTTTV